MVVALEENAQTAALRSAGCEVLTVGCAGSVCPIPLLLDVLGKRRMTNILVEGGAEVLGSFFDARLVDEIWAFLAPTIVGGSGKSPVGGAGAAKMTEALALAEWQIENVDGNVLMHGWLR